MVRIALVLLAVLVLAAAAAAPDPVPTTPFYRMQKGQTVECSQAEGCVAMTAEAYRQLIKAAHDHGAEQCTAKRGTYL